MSRKHSAHKPKRNRSLIGRFLGRLFCQRNIIIISDHKTDHVPVSIRRQLVVIALVLGFVVWASFSTGRYMSAQKSLKEKEQEIASTSLKNRRIESEFALLKRDLVSMLESSKKEDLGEYAQFVIEQYKKNGEDIESLDIDFEQLGKTQHGAVFERIAFLEDKVEAMKQDHDRVLESIRDTARGKIRDLETIIRTTGLNLKNLEKQAAAKVNAVAEAEDAQGPRGGPYAPLNEDVLKSYDPNLYQDLRRMVVLDELVNYLPLDLPMQHYKITSGYGMRVDPFRKRLARHAGLDFAGPRGARVLSANRGTVKFAGRRGAYGVMVEIDHGFGISTRYGHLQQILVKKGQRVPKGHVIGVQGSTGRSTGPHLHYEVRYYNTTLNPQNFLKAGSYVKKIKQ